MTRLAIFVAPLILSACMTNRTPEPNAGPTGAAIGETVHVDGPKVTALAVLEDSRCPQGMTCVWAGRVRINARIELGSKTYEQELISGTPVQVADGSLELVEVLPPAIVDQTIASEDYRFSFRFMGGI